MTYAGRPARVEVPDYRRATLAERIAQNTERERAKLRDRTGRDLAAQLIEVQHIAARARATGRMPDAELRMLAQRRADLMRDTFAALPAAMTPAGFLQWLNATLEPLQGRAFAFEGDRPEADQLRGFTERAQCPLWWRRQLRRAAVRDREGEGQRTGEVCASKRQPYVTHDTAHRHAQRRAANAVMMAATQLENDGGQVMTLAELAARSPSNKGIRRGELMTRIAGCERWAEAAGARGVFLTLTAPSRFHRVHRDGRLNDRHDGSTPKDAQAWLSAQWARARAALQRRGVAIFGFRVAEPHHDGCPHWHALLWAAPGMLWRAVRVIKRAWLKHEGDEPGARAHRCKAVLMRPGGASGYIAKYVAKNIDDAGAVGVEGHTDDDFGDAVPRPAQADAFGGTAQRVEAWASAWGIRQFQAIGQPPVTVWRELRRVEAAGGATDRLAAALEAVNRKGSRRADWAAYVLAQGGMGKGRDYLLKLAHLERFKVGRYESGERPCVIGVIDTTGPGEVQLSNRREWRPRGAWNQGEREGARGIWAPRAAPPWTRVNNCTHLAALEAAHKLREAGRLTFLEPGEVQESQQREPEPPPGPDPHRRRELVGRFLADRHHRG